jgi:hypothetical protein
VEIMGKKNKNYKINREGFKMAVSMGVLPTLKGQAAKNVLDSLKNPTMDKKFLDRCDYLSSMIKKGTPKK